MQAKVHKFAGSLPSAKDLEQLQRDAPGLFDSGYFVLAAVEGAPAVAREQATFTINLLRGGTAGQIVVVPKQSPGDPATRALGDRLHSMSDGFAARTHTQVAVGGPAGNLADFTSVSSEKLPAVVVALALATALLLMLALRSVLVPIVAVALNLLTVAATFGVLTLLFTGSDPLLGGPGYIDAMSIIAIFSATFGLSIAYEVFLLARMREHVLAGDSPRAAARHGLRHTAAAVTGTAAVMVAATLPFLFADLLSVRQFGVGLVTVVLLDALLVRPVVLPAAVELLGRRAWWPTRAPHLMPGGTGPSHPRDRPPRRVSTRPRCRHDHPAVRPPDHHRAPDPAGGAPDGHRLALGRGDALARSQRPRTPSRTPSVGRAADEIADGLAALGVQPGDRVAILAGTRAEWALADLGALWAGATVVPIYNTNSPEECQYVLAHSGSRVVFCEDAAQLAKIDSIGAQCPDLEHRVVLTGSAPGAMTLDALRERGRALDEPIAAARTAAVRPRRRGHDRLHVGHDRAAQGLHAHARQPPGHDRPLPGPAGAGRRAWSPTSSCHWPTCWLA